MKGVNVIVLVAASTLLSLINAENNLEAAEERNAKLISTFQIVRFPNDACTGSSSTRNGTCYTSAECSDKGGTSSGSCADGFGVCCTFVISECGKSSSENITYWDAPATIPSGECSLEILPINDNICQLRLDFLTFVVTGPSTTTITEIGIRGTSAKYLVTIAMNSAVWTTNCLTDSFSVSSNNPANKPPTICGTNSGYHMYVDMDSDHSNVLSFIFATRAGPAQAAQNTRGVISLASRDWDITAMQYECGYINSAPPGCTQYFWSDSGLQVNGWITSYNFQASTKHLANQNQKVCIRRERTICWASFYMTIIGGRFDISGKTLAADTDVALLTFTGAGQPCGYQCQNLDSQGDADDQCSYDCVIIPGLFAVATAAGAVDVDASNAIVRLGIAVATNHAPAGPQIGGTGIFGVAAIVAGGAAVAGDASAQTLFTKHVPFQVTFKSDGFEGVGMNGDQGIAALGANTIGLGMKLSYDLIPCTA